MTASSVSNTNSAKQGFDISSATLHVIAMLFMLCDHLWATVISGNDWLTCIGRLAFPIFAFMTVEGYFRTKNLKKYVLRLLIFAVISEIPFNLMYSSGFLFPFHQNVLWTFLIGIGAMHLNELARKKDKLWLRILTGVVTIVVGYLLGIITFVDYNGAGVLTILAFYFFRGRRWWCFIGQAAALYYINFELLSGLQYEISMFGGTVFFPQQGFALLALIPIWLYKGRQGYHSKWFQYFCYSFYPLHMLILFVVRSFI